MRQIWIPRIGPPEVLELREAPDPLPGDGELRIRVEAVGVNFADVVGRLGLYPDMPAPPVVPGYEVAGRVDAVGRDVEFDWVGREVFALTRFGGYSDVVCVREPQVHVRPAGMDAEQGAAFPVNYLTAYQLIEVMGGLGSAETVLIHSAGGGVGIAAVQLAHRIGARIIGTASAAKHGFLESIGVDACIDYTCEDFELRLRELTDGRGAELIADAVGGRSFKKSFRALAASGRLGMFGMSSSVRSGRRRPLALLRALFTTPWLRFHPWQLISQNKGVFGVNLGHLWDEADRVGAWMEVLLGYYRAGTVKPVIAARCPFEEAAEAHRMLQERRNIGKVLLIP
ncbi:MAG: zinc-binding dehydrogenase [Myxococcota bacterium]